MYTDQDRDLLFYAACLPVRFGLALAAKHANTDQLQLAGIVALIAGLIFITVYITKSRDKQGVFGGRVWWSWTRPVHGAVLILFAILALSNSEHAWTVLMADATLAAVFY